MKSSYNVEDRQIRIFISSTFRDMQVERDHLITKVFPKLRAEAAKRDVTVVPLDLRWGVTEEESKSGKVIQICLEEIMHSHPFFIGLLGNRYGWCPPKSEFQSNELLQERFGWVADDIDHGLSVTEMEMQFGVLRNEEKIDAYFYIRKDDAPAEEDAEKLERLKTAVRNNKQGYPVYDYATEEDLGEQVEKDFMALLNRLYPEGALSELEKERLAQKSFLRDRCRVYIPNEENFKALDDFLQSEEKHFVVTGESGMGKSALIANWIERIKNDDSRHIIYHFVGNGTMEGSHQQIAQRLYNEIRDLYQLPEQPNELGREDVFKQLEKLFIEVATKKPLLIVLDGVNQLANVENAKLLNWLPEPARNTKILFSTLKDDETMQVFEGRHYPVFTLQPLTEQARTTLVESYLGMYRKRLMPTQIARIVSDEQNKNTLVLKTMLDELVSFGVYEELDHRIDYYLKAESIEDFYQRVLHRYETDYDEKLVRHILSLLAFSRSGLGEQELIDILGIRDKLLPWSQFYCAFRNHLMTKNGLISFSHAYIRQACETRYAADETTTRQEIASYFKDSKTPRAYDELPHQYYELKDYDSLYNFLLNFEVFDYIDTKDGYELGKYWRTLIEVDKDAYSLRAYLSLPAKDVEQRARIFNMLGSFVCYEVVDYSLSLEYSQKALSLSLNVFGQNHPNTARSHSNLGGVYTRLNDYKKASKHCQKALGILLNVIGENDTHTAMLYNSLGKVYADQGNYVDAMDCYQKALKIDLNKLGENHLDIADIYESIGILCLQQDQDNYADALKYYQKSLRIRLDKLGENSPVTAKSYGNVGSAYYKQGNNDKALDNFQKGLRAQLESLGENHPDTATYYNNIGIVYSNIGDYDNALDNYKKALRIRLDKLGENNLDTAVSYNNIGLLYGDLKDYDNALKYSLKGLRIRLDKLGENHLDTAVSYHNVGMAYSDQGLYDEALKHYHKALKTALKALDNNNLSENHPYVELIYSNIGSVYLLQGEYIQALKYFHKTMKICKALNYSKEKVSVLQHVIDDLSEMLKDPTTANVNIGDRDTVDNYDESGKLSQSSDDNRAQSREFIGQEALEQSIKDGHYSEIIEQLKDESTLSFYEAYYLSLANLRLCNFDEAFYILSTMVSVDLDGLSDGEVFSMATNYMIAALLSGHFKEYENLYSELSEEDREDSDIIEIHQAYMSAKAKGSSQVVLPQPYGYMI